MFRFGLQSSVLKMCSNELELMCKCYLSLPAAVGTSLLWVQADMLAHKLIRQGLHHGLAQGPTNLNPAWHR